MFAGWASLIVPGPRERDSSCTCSCVYHTALVWFLLRLRSASWIMMERLDIFSLPIRSIQSINTALTVLVFQEKSPTMSLVNLDIAGVRVHIGHSDRDDGPVTVRMVFYLSALRALVISTICHCHRFLYSHSLVPTIKRIWQNA